MGILTATSRMFTLNSQRLDYDYKVQLISQAEMDLSSKEAELINAGTDLSSDSPVLKQLEARKERLHLLEKKLANQKLQYQNKLKLIETELESCKAMFDKDVKNAASYQ